ncbi:unnamed protein product [Lactuca saligna]|uniref:Uncharacterized protein n=1 Tax=Lactuca saligna TaxID=75948 RepID=A0AA35VUT2_LACSI|nr:unnamed protein product [Lactuca saligna]
MDSDAWKLILIEISQALVLNGFRGRLSLKIEGEDFETLVTKSTHQDTATRMTTTVHISYNTSRYTRLTAKKYSQLMKREATLRNDKVVDETGSREKKVNKRKVKSVERNEQLEAMDVELDMNEMDKSGQHEIHGYQALLPFVSTFFCSFSSVTGFSGQSGSSLGLNCFNRNTLIGPKARKFEQSPMMSVEPTVVGEAKSARGEVT